MLNSQQRIEWVSARGRTYTPRSRTALNAVDQRGCREDTVPRPASWLPRLYDITRSVTNSVRSHYQRRDLELLFELQPRAAQKLLKMLPTTEVGTGHLVSRETLLSFLARVRDAEDTTVLFEQLRQDRHNSSRKKIRSLVQTDFAPASFASLPQRVTLSPGRLEVTFQTVDELAESLMKIAQLLAEEGDLFATSYEPKKPPKFDDEADEVQRMFAELEAMEAQRAAERVKHET